MLRLLLEVEVLRLKWLLVAAHGSIMKERPGRVQGIGRGERDGGIHRFWLISRGCSTRAQGGEDHRRAPLERRGGRWENRHRPTRGVQISMRRTPHILAGLVAAAAAAAMPGCIPGCDCGCFPGGLDMDYWDGDAAVDRGAYRGLVVDDVVGYGLEGIRVTCASDPADGGAMDGGGSDAGGSDAGGSDAGGSDGGGLDGGATVGNVDLTDARGEFAFDQACAWVRTDDVDGPLNGSYPSAEVAAPRPWNADTHFVIRLKKVE